MARRCVVWGRLAVLVLMLVWGMMPAQAQTVRVVGSTTLKSFVDEAARAYMAAHPEVLVLVDGGGSGEGARKLLNGEADVAMMSRPVTETERRMLARMGATHHAAGLDGVVVVVSGDIYHAGIHALSREQIRDIWRGRIMNWKQLGGPDRRILVVGRVAGSGTWGVFTHWLWGSEMPVRPMVLMESNRYTQNLMMASDQAIGYLPLGWTNDLVHAVVLKTAEGAIRPTAAVIRAGRWPMARKLALWVRPDAPKVVRDFVSWLCSSQARSMLEQAGYLPPGKK